MPDLPADICLYFGTFNPIHTGHLMIAQSVLHQFSQELGIKTVTFIPTGNPPHRGHEPDLLAARHRLKMVQLATRANPAFRVSPIECQHTRISYTIDTLREWMQAGQVQSPIPMIIGSDALAGLSTWREPEALIEAVCFLQIPRPGTPGLHSVCINGREMQLNTRFIRNLTLSLSSSWIRATLQESSGYSPMDAAAAVRYFLPEPVRRYIADNQLYSTPKNRE